MDFYDVVIVATLVGFLALAIALLLPVYRFLQREERASEAWTDEALARQHREATPPPNGATEQPEAPPRE